MKKILFLNYEFPPLGGGASPVSYEVAKSLAKTGKFEIDVVTMGFKGLPQFEQLESNLRIHRVKCLRSKREICYPWEQATYLVSAFFKSVNLIYKNRYDICYTHFIIPTSALALVLKRLFGLKYVITSHGSDIIGYNKRFKFLYPLVSLPWKVIVRNAERVTTPSLYLKKRILTVYPKLKEDKVEVIPNGINKDKFCPTPKEKIVLLTSRLFINKGLQDFFKSIRDIDLNDWRILIVGEGPYRKELESLTIQYGLKEHVEFLGWMDNNDKRLKEIYGKASIFVNPSHFESFGLTLLESMQAGCMPIVSNTGAMSEIAKDFGYIFNVEDTVKLRDYVENAISRGIILPERAQEISRSINENYTWEILIKKYINTLNLY